MLCFSCFESLFEAYKKDMGREVRQVPVDWSHPVNEEEQYVPLFEEDMECLFTSKPTLYMMYETCSEGTPLSPPFATTEELAQWCFDHAVSMFGPYGGSLEEWQHVCRKGYGGGLHVAISHVQ